MGSRRACFWGFCCGSASETGYRAMQSTAVIWSGSTHVHVSWSCGLSPSWRHERKQTPTRKSVREIHASCWTSLHCTGKHENSLRHSHQSVRCLALWVLITHLGPGIGTEPASQGLYKSMDSRVSARLPTPAPGEVWSRFGDLTVQ